MSDIVDDRQEKRVPTIGRILEYTERSRFTLEHFFAQAKLRRYAHSVWRSGVLASVW